MTSNHRLKVGIDFGTTFSGISWIYTMKPDEVNVVMKWPGAPNASAKVPSEILYSSDGTVRKWGFQLKFPDEPIAWFKLLLHPTQYDFADCSMLSGTQNLVSPKKPVDIVADYLTCLRVHFLDVISGSIGKAFLNATPVDYTLTVPAIWKDPAKALTLEAAEKAGLGTKDTIRLMSEPDAAAAWTLLRDINPNNLKVRWGMHSLLWIAGVDLISYQVQDLNPLTVNECVKGTGGLCGSVFLNRGFLDLVKSRIGDLFKKMKPATRNRMVSEWELVLKRDFSNSEEDDLSSCPIGPIPDNSELRILDGELLINREEMLAIFDPVIGQIITLVQEQIDMVAAKDDPELQISVRHIMIAIQ
ncbi:hypothetical protein Q9L58_001910 [Maublancomyces gigas]|uniref:Uncharacterized protein n=1 Tax=Discina gigas TaxID=1032678 RepID=A0ABR3GSX7_9PEZI